MGYINDSLSDNPILCGDNFVHLNICMAQWHVKVYGECVNRRIPDIFSPTVVAPSLLNDIMPLGSGLIVSSKVNPGVKVIPLESHINSKNKLFPGYDNVVGQIIPGKNGELPIIFYPPITLPPPTQSPSTKQQRSQHKIQNVAPEIPPKII